jgi:GR25 family glycosyltransferase involved in LPS biosynthesis
MDREGKPVGTSPPTPPWPRELQTVLAITIREERYARFLKGWGEEERKAPGAPTVIRVDGVDGRALRMPLPADRYQPIRRGGLRRGEIGCYLAHVRAWERLLQLPPGVEKALIVEDDCVMPWADAGKREEIDRALRQADDFKWDLCFVGRNPALCQERRRIRTNLVVPGMTWGLFAYVLSREGAHRLLANAFPLRAPADIYVSMAAFLPRKIAITPIPIKIREDEVSDTLGIV